MILVEQHEVDQFLQDHYSEQMQHVLNDFIELCSAFQVATLYPRLIDVVNDYNADDKDSTELKFLGVFTDTSDEIFEAHQIRVHQETHLDIRNELLSVLATLQDVENYIPILRILESSFSTDEKFARIAETCCRLTMEEVLQAVESIDPSTLSILQTILYQKEEGEETPLLANELEHKLRANYEDFIAVFGKDNLGYKFIEMGLPIGHPFETYEPFVKEYVKAETIEQTALNLVSVFFMSPLTYLDPARVFKIVSERLFDHDTTDQFVKIELEITKAVAKLRHYQESMKLAKTQSQEAGIATP